MDSELSSENLDPDVIFLSETRGSSNTVENLKTRWSLHGVGVSSIANSGSSLVMEEICSG